MWTILDDSPEFTARIRTPFKPTKVTLVEIQASVPKHLFKKNTFKTTIYLFRSLAFSFLLYRLGWIIDPWWSSLVESCSCGNAVRFLLKWSLWGLYWHWQGIIFTGLWGMGHDASHGSLSDYKWYNNFVGFSLHTFLLFPYFSWRATHQAHHKATMLVEREENYVPRTRKYYGLPPESKARTSDYSDIFEETPVYTLINMIGMQLFGLQLYLLNNTFGSPRYPPGTNHFQPTSPLFKPHQRREIVLSNLGLASMAFILYRWTWGAGVEYFLKLYFVPYILANHWIIMLTYLQHSDPSIPYYRNKEWSFLRGALGAVDRPFLGWVGRFFLHNMAHDHVAHHLFSSVPFYNLPQVTEAIKPVLQGDYNYDSTNAFRALYRTFTQCCFIEDEGDIIFYKNRDGRSSRVLAEDFNAPACLLTDECPDIAR